MGQLIVPVWFVGVFKGHVTPNNWEPRPSLYLKYGDIRYQLIMECSVMSDILSTTCKTNKSLKGQCYRIHYTIALILKQLAICRSKNQVKGSRMSWFNGIKSKCLQPRVEIVRIQQSRVACQNFRVECQEMMIKNRVPRGNIQRL